jgi:hypothetical protein
LINAAEASGTSAAVKTTAERAMIRFTSSPFVGCTGRAR